MTVRGIEEQMNRQTFIKKIKGREGWNAITSN